jgi:hypothetical protein
MLSWYGMVRWLIVRFFMLTWNVLMFSHCVYVIAKCNMSEVANLTFILFELLRHWGCQATKYKIVLFSDNSERSNNTAQPEIADTGAEVSAFLIHVTDIRKTGTCWSWKRSLIEFLLLNRTFAHLPSSLHSVVDLFEKKDIHRGQKADGRFFWFNYFFEQPQTTNDNTLLKVGFSGFQRSKTRWNVNVQVYGRCKAWTCLNLSLYIGNMSFI